MRFIPTMQVLWLVVYWWGVLPVLYLLVVAVQADAGLDRFGTLLIALTGSVLGCVFATRIARQYVGSTAFVKGTTTIRVISIAWHAIATVILLGAVLSSFGVSFGEDGAALGIVSTVGAVSLLAMLGPGYSEYREIARPDPATPAQHEPLPAPEVDAPPAPVPPAPVP